MTAVTALRDGFRSLERKPSMDQLTEHFTHWEDVLPLAVMLILIKVIGFVMRGIHDIVRRHGGCWVVLQKFFSKSER